MRSRDDAVSVEWIDSNAALHDAFASAFDVLAVDTEFVRTNTYFPVPGLYQIFTGDVVYLIDPLTIDAWDPLIRVLEDPQVVKVMHACQEDIEMMYHHLDVTAANVFDTQFAHAFVSTDFSLSYANLVSQLLDVSLDKQETRSDWLQRPLSPEQLDYAVQDVTYLIPLYAQLVDRLQDQGKWDWFNEDMLDRGTYTPVNPAEYYRNLKKAWRFSSHELARLQALCAWRERTAQEENVPRNRVVWDDHLFQFARRNRLNAADVQSALPRAVARRYADQLVELMAQMSGDTTAPPLDQPLNSRQGAMVKAMRVEGLRIAEQRALAPELLCRKRDLEACVRAFLHSGELSELFQSWRATLVGDTYLNILQTGTQRG